MILITRSGMGMIIVMLLLLTNIGLTGCGSANKAVLNDNPVNTLPQKLMASDAEANDYFGRSAGISGDYIIVGAYEEDSGGSSAGAAYIFHRTAENMWDGGAKIKSFDLEAGDNFGISVAISGDYAIVGANGERSGGFSAGAAYIFHRTGENRWDRGAKITAPGSGTVAENFGNSVSISGDYAIVGGFGKDSQGRNSGAAYIFHRTDENTWDKGIKIESFDLAYEDNFGVSVAIDGDYAIVGASGESSGGGTDAGAAYIFHRTGENTWDIGAKVMAVDPERDDYYGNSVAISGDYAIVGSYGENSGGGNDAGAAYIYHRIGENAWDIGTKIMAPDAEREDRFGKVAISGDYVIVGAYQEDSGGDSAGAAYIYRRTGENAWDAGRKIMAIVPQQDDYFGISVAISEDYAIAGAFGGFNMGRTGAAYIFDTKE